MMKYPAQRNPQERNTVLERGGGFDEAFTIPPEGITVDDKTGGMSERPINLLAELDPSMKRGPGRL